MTILKKLQEELINWHLLFATPIHHRSAMLMSYVIQSCNIRAIGYDAESMLQLEFSLCCITFHGDVSSKNRVLVAVSWMSYCRLRFLVITSNFVKWIQNSCHWTKFHRLFSSFCQIEFCSVELYLYLPLYWNFFYKSDNFCVSNLKTFFVLVFFSLHFSTKFFVT